MSSLKIFISPVTEKLKTSNLNSRKTSLKDISPAIERPQGLRLSTQMLKSSSTSCSKCFMIIKFSKFCKKDKCSYGSLALVFVHKTS